MRFDDDDHDYATGRTEAAPASSFARALTRPRLSAREGGDEQLPISGASLVWEALVQEGVEVVFGYPGGMIMPAYDALPGHPIRHVLVRHEQGAAHMADGYARASGKIGVAIATSGPGATNLVTGIANAMMDSIPMVCITGQVPSFLIGTDAFQETDITGITMPITKHNFLVERAEDIVPAIRKACRIARSGRKGPVLVDITKDAQLEKTTRARFAPSEANSWATARAIEGAPGLGARSLDEALLSARSLLNQAERPLILAGHGIVQADATEALVSFAERTRIPVACTLLGLSALPGTHPLHLGMMGMHGDAWVNEAIQRADLLIALGMRFDDRATGKLADYAPKARVIHVDADAAELHKNVPAEVAINADVRSFLERMLPGCPAVSSGQWLSEISESRHSARKRDILSRPAERHLHGAHVIHDLWCATSGQATLVADVGQHQMWAAQYYRSVGAGRFITSGGLGTMGFALPAAIGAKIARPAEEVWVVAGDGGFQMTASELSTLVQEELKIDIAIINNRHLGLVRQQQELFYGKRYVESSLPGPDFVTLARAHGVEALRVERRDQVAGAIAHARSAQGPVLIDFEVEALDIVYPTVAPDAKLDDMIRRPLPSRPGLIHAPAHGSGECLPEHRES